MVQKKNMNTFLAGALVFDLKTATVVRGQYEEEDEVGRGEKNKWEIGFGLILWSNGSDPLRSPAWLEGTLAVSNIAWAMAFSCDDFANVQWIFFPLNTMW